ncbi:MAG: hypothetical protein Q7V62_17040 [Actinomycetota bacterium]|nr:hypothetical protein [Actinomycetota bacterium]
MEQARTRASIVYAGVDDADLLRIQHTRFSAARLSYADARVLDATRNPLQPPDWSACVNSYTLADELRRAVCAASFFGDIADVRDPLTSLFSKALNSRCQARKYGTVAEKALLETERESERVQAVLAKWRAQAQETPPRHRHQAKDEKLVADSRARRTRRRHFRAMVLCSLLGNYPHCRTRMACPRARKALYARLGGANAEHSVADLAWFQQLLHQAPRLVVWCVRDFIVHTLRGDLALREQVSSLMHLAHFEELTQQAMTTARAYLETRITRAWHPASAVPRPPHLCRCHRAKDAECEYAGAAWLTRDMSALMQPYHDRMLAVQYRKPHVDVATWLVGAEVRKAAPLVPLYSLSERPMLHDAFMARIARADHVMGPRELAIEWEQMQRREAVAAEDVVANAYAYLSPAQFGALRMCVDAVPSIDEVVRSGFVHLGCTQDAVDFVLRLLEHHRAASMPKQARARLLLHLHARSPHTYNLLQMTAELVRERGPHGAHGRVVGRLCAETHEAQMRAADAKMLDVRQHLQRALLAAVEKVRDAHPGCADDAVAAQAEIHAELEAIRERHRVRAAGQPLVESTSVRLYYCAVCNQVYSNVHTPGGKYFRFGMRDATRAYTGPGDPHASTYCRNALVNHAGACATQLLSSVSLLGVVYAFRKCVYQLCVGCADIFTPEADVMRAGFADAGLLCCACTRKQEAQRAAVDPTLAFVAQYEQRCAVCPLLTTNGTAHLLPHLLVLCRRHAKPFVLNRVAERYWATQADLRAHLIAQHVAYKARRRMLAQPGDMRRMKANKQRARGRKA